MRSIARTMQLESRDAFEEVECQKEEEVDEEAEEECERGRTVRMTSRGRE